MVWSKLHIKEATNGSTLILRLVLLALRRNLGSSLFLFTGPQSIREPKMRRPTPHFFLDSIAERSRGQHWSSNAWMVLARRGRADSDSPGSGMVRTARRPGQKAFEEASQTSSADYGEI